MMTLPTAGGKDRPRALVTGGAVRVGRAIALALAAAGMDVAIGYHRSAADAARTRRAIVAHGGRGVALRADLGRADGARALVGRAAAALGGLDVLVNSAAVFPRTPLAHTTPAQWDAILAVNLRAPFVCAQAAARAMRGRGGHIVNIGDAGADGGWPSYIPYAVSKAGIVALTRELAAALGPARIAVNCVAPGPVLRPRGFPLARWSRLAGRHAPSVADVAAAAVYFASCPRGITGQVLRVDRGAGE
jgi:NAD(P)-dependent dehydrogenase (short-subunit alcohol dehydrogenase family)